MTPEAKVKKKVKAILESHGAYYAMPIGAGFGNAGVPDFLICLRGRFVAIECKAADNKPTALQQRELKNIMTAGGHAFVANEENISFFESYFNTFDDFDSKEVVDNVNHILHKTAITQIQLAKTQKQI